MRCFLLLLAFAAAAAGCERGPKPADDETIADVLNPAPLSAAAFPKPRAAYQAEYRVYDDDGAARDMTIFASGARFRMESLAEGAAAYRKAAIMDPANRRVLSFRAGGDQPKLAIALQLDSLGRAADFFRREDEPQNARAVGRDRVAETPCIVWEIPPAGEGRPASRACISADGILLRDGDVGAPHPNIEAVRVRRGAQPEGLFATPPGYEIVDFAPCLALQKEAVAAARAGKAPDPARVAACEALSRKVEAVMGPG